MLGIGIDVGNDQAVSAPPLVGGQPDERAQAYVHGLQVIPELDRMMFGFVWFGPTRTRVSSEGFIRALSDAYGRTLTPKQNLAVRLYNQSHFQSSDEARFLMLVMAVEALAEQRERSEVGQQLVRTMIEATDQAAGLTDDERNSLRGSLQRLRYESIGATCRKLVAQRCGADAEKAFTHAYTIRGQLVHDGTIPAATDMPAEIDALDVLVRRLLVNDIAGREMP